MGLKLSANLNKTFANLSRDIENEQKRVVKEVLLNTHNQIIITSPVDTGTYRANHFLEADSATKNATQDNNENQRTAEAQSVSIALNNGKKYILYNPIEYAEALEAGHSPQRPQGIYAPAAEFMRSFIKKQKMKINIKVEK